MQTVDQRDDLKDKVTSSGIVNKERAVSAATLSLSLPLNDAIADSFERVPVVKRSKSMAFPLVFEGIALPLPSFIQ